MTYIEATQFLYGLRRFGWRLGLETVDTVEESRKYKSEGNFYV